MRYLGGADSESGLRFLRFWPQNPFSWVNSGRKGQSCPFCLKIDTRDIWSMLILIPTLVFWTSKPRSICGKIWAEKVKVVHFGWKLAHSVSRRCLLILILTLLFSASNFQSIFGQIWAEKLFILTENWHTWYIKDADSYFDISFLNSQP